MTTKSIDIISYVFACISIVLILFGCFAPLIFTQCRSIVDFTETGQIGDTIGGTMSPIIAIAGVFMTFIAFLMQVNANKIQSAQLKKSLGLKLLENKVDSRNALQLLSVDIKVLLKEIDLTCQEIDAFCTYTEERPTGDIAFHFTPKKSHGRYLTIDRNLVYNAYISFIDSSDMLEDFRKTYSLLDFYTESMDLLYSNTYKPHTDDIMDCKKLIPTVFQELCEKITSYAVNTDLASKQLVNLFNIETSERLIHDGLLDIYALHGTLNDGRFSLLFQVSEDTYVKLLSLINRLITQNRMLVHDLRDTEIHFKNAECYDALVALKDKIDLALSIHTIESIQNEFEEQAN